MKKAENIKEKKETKKKAAPAAKKAAPKAKKEVKKSLAPAKPAPEVKQEIKPKKISKESAPKVEAPKQAPVEKAPLIEERKAAPEKKRPPKVVQYHGTGGRKTSGARVWLSQGTGRYIINGKPLENYTCKRNLLLKMAMEPFVVTNTLGKYDVQANANGGGICSQIGAVRQAVSVAIMQANPEFRAALKKAGLLTRDSRMKERKKYGQKRARKRFQYSKR
jgi:small subunit ribosomal protein S9